MPEITNPDNSDIWDLKILYHSGDGEMGSCAL